MNESILFKEINEQPDALARFLDAESANVEHIASAIQRAGVSYITIAARGSSGNCHSAIDAGFVTSIRPCCTAWPISVAAIDFATEKVRWAVWTSCPPQ